jgi:hypothetical protein
MRQIRQYAHDAMMQLTEWSLRMIRIRLAVSAALVLGLAGAAAAQTYPERAIRLIVPFPAGGPTDSAARIVAQALSSRIGQRTRPAQAARSAPSRWRPPIPMATRC